ncbi:MAG: ABC transporter ATP-binding protein [Burkholderiaceae bacterium]
MSRLIVLGALIETAGDARFEGLNVRIGPGLALIRGGEGRGKTSLLRRIAAAPGITTSWQDPGTPLDDQSVARDWLKAQALRQPGWDPVLEQEALEGFRLHEHLDKRLFMLSSGTTRKLMLAATLASQAECILLSLPFGALDGRSRSYLAGLLARRAKDARGRCCVLADYEWPIELSDVPPSVVIDLGD